MLSIFAIGVGLDLVLRQGGGQHPPGLGDPRRDDGAVPRRRRRRLLAGSGRQSDAARSSASRAATWKARKSASASPPRAVLGRHHGSLVRRGQCDARQLHRARRHDPAVQHAARRNRRRRRRRGHLRLPAVRAARGVRRRADGRPHARICRQEDRGQAKSSWRCWPSPCCRCASSASPRSPRCCRTGLAGPLNKGPHGFTEILYAFSQRHGNNGSAFAGLTSGTPFYNGLLGVAMWIGRFFMIVPVLAIAGSPARG